MTKQEAIDLVSRHLEKHQPAEYRIEVLPDTARQDEDWWYIAVQADRDDIPRYDYYNVLAVIEREIQDEDDSNNILLVPAAAGAA